MIADLCVIGIVVLFIALGYRAGFVRSCVNVAAIGISIAFSLMVYPLISELIKQTSVYSMFVDFISKHCLNNVDVFPTNGVWSAFDGILKNGQGVIAQSIATALINIIAFIGAVVLCRLVLFVLTHALDLVARLPVIRTFNRLGGSVMGGLIGIVVVYLILSLAVVVLPMDTSGIGAKELKGSKIASQMYNNNILISIIKGE